MLHHEWRCGTIDQPSPSSSAGRACAFAGEGKHGGSSPHDGPLFDYQSITSYVWAMTEATQSILQQWKALPAGATIELSAETMQLTPDIIARYMFSTESDAIVDIVCERSERYQEVTMFGLLNFAPVIGPVWGHYKAKLLSETSMRRSFG